jgi:WD40 repeat protein
MTAAFSWAECGDDQMRSWKWSSLRDCDYDTRWLLRHMLRARSGGGGTPGEWARRAAGLLHQPPFLLHFLLGGEGPARPAAGVDLAPIDRLLGDLEEVAARLDGGPGGDPEWVEFLLGALTPEARHVRRPGGPGASRQAVPQLYSRLVLMNPPPGGQARAELLRLIRLVREALADAAGGPWLRRLNGMGSEPCCPLPLQMAGSVAARALAGPEGGCLAAAGADGVVRVWDLRQPWAAPLELGAPGGAAHALAWAGPDHLAAGCGDGVVRAWDLRSPEAPPRALERHEGPVRGLVSVEGTRLVSAGEDGRLLLWDLAGGAAQDLGPKRGRITALARFADRQRTLLAEAGDGREVQVWDLAHSFHEPRWRFEVEEWDMGPADEGEGGRVLTWLGGARLAVGAPNGGVQVWGLSGSGGQRLSHLSRRDSDPVRSLADLGRDRVAAAYRSGVVRVWKWDRTTDAWEAELPGHRGGTDALLRLDDGRFASAGRDGPLRVWDVSRPAPPAAGRPEGPVHALARLESGALVSAGAEGRLRLWEMDDPSDPRESSGVPRGGAARLLRAFRWLFVWALAHGERGPPVRALAALGGSRVAAGDAEGVTFWDGDDLRWPLAAWKDKGRKGCTALAWLPSRDWLAVGCEDERVYVRGVSRPYRVVWKAGPVPGRVRGMTWLGERLLLGGEWGVWAWDPHREETLQWSEVPAWAVERLGGHRVAAAGEDGRIRVWELPSAGQVAAELRGHEGAVRALAPLGGRRLASAGEDGTVRVWDLESSSCLAHFAGDYPFAALAVLGASGDDPPVLAAFDDSPRPRLHVWEVCGLTP